jgi:succinoglycan biosynthesis transport protein ExoP
MTATQIIRILWARRRLMFVVLCTVVGAVAAVSLVLPKQYEAELALVVDIKGDNPLGEGALAPQLVPTYLSTQAEILRSRSVALKVIDNLGLAKSPSAIEHYQGRDSADIRERLVGPVLKNLDARTTRNSNIIRVSYRSTDPEVAAAMANGFADAYIQTSLELHVDPSKRQALWFDQQVQQLRQELANAQATLSAYQRDHGVLGVDDARLDIENARLQEISTHLVAVQAAMYEAETRRNQIAGKSNPEELPDLLQHPLLQNLKSELARAEAKLAELSGRYDRNHPQYRSTAAEVAALRDKLNSEIAVARGSLVQGAQMARRQVDEVQKALDEQKERILALKRQRDELSVLQRDVESARAAYDAALAEANRARLESRIDRTNIAVLNPATAPLTPASPRVALNIVVAAVVGLMLAAGLALMLELFKRRLRSSEDLLELGDIAVLAELPALPPVRGPRRPPALRHAPARLGAHVA